MARQIGRGKSRGRSRAADDQSRVVFWGLISLGGIAVGGAVALVLTALATGMLSLTPKATTAQAAAPPAGPNPPAVPPNPPGLNPALPPPRPNPVLLPPAPPPVKAPPNPRTPAEDGYYTQEKAREFTPINKMYTAHMPAGERSRNLQKFFHIERHVVPLEGAEVESGGMTYSAASLGIPAVLMREIPAEDRCDTLCEAMFKSKNGKVIGKKVIRQEPVAGKEFLVEMTDSAARVQVYTIAGWVVMGVVEGKDMAAVRSADADAFLAGVKLSDEAKKLYREISR